MSATDFLDSFSSHFRERFNSPLLVSFTVSWIGWNYKLLFVLFSKLQPDQKFDFVKVLYPDSSVLLEGALLYPVLSALGFVLLYPNAYRLFLRYSLWQQKLTQKVRTRGIENQILLPEQIKKMRGEYRALIESAESEVERKTDQATRYKTERDKAEATLVDDRASAKLQIEALQAELLPATAELGRLREENKAKVELIDILTNGTADLKSKLDRSQELLLNASTNYERKEFEARDLTEQLSHVNEMFKSSQDRAADLQSRLASAAMTDAELRNIVDSLKVRLKSTELRVEKFQVIAKETKKFFQVLVDGNIVAPNDLENIKTIIRGIDSVLL